jgi:hypothetical protein
VTAEERGRPLPESGPDTDMATTIPLSKPSANDSRRSPRSQPARRSRRSIRSDSPETVAATVATILDGAPTPEEAGLPHSLQELARIRSAARRILEEELAPPERDQLLGALARRAAHGELAEWCLDAIVTEIRGPDVEAVDHSVTTAHERLRRGGFEACPICLNRVLTEIELDARRRREKVAREALERWEGVAR